MATDGSLDTPDQPARERGQPSSGTRASTKSHDRPVIGRRVRRGIEVSKEKYSGSAAEDLWHRLDALDFMNQAMVLAGTFLLCVFPFLIVLSDLAGRGAASTFSRRLGLNQQAAADMGHLFTSSGATSATITTACLILLVLFALAGASVVHELYLRIFGLDPRGTRDLLRKLIRVGLVVGWLLLGGLVGPRCGPAGRCRSGLSSWSRLPVSGGSRCGSCSAGGSPGAGYCRAPWPPGCAGWAWWPSSLSHLLGHGHLVLRRVRPDRRRVFGLLSYILAVGVVIILGAVVGLVWHERGLSFRAAFGNRGGPR